MIVRPAQTISEMRRNWIGPRRSRPRTDGTAAARAGRLRTDEPATASPARHRRPTGYHPAVKRTRARLEAKDAVPPPRTVSAAVARRFLVVRHLLAPPRALPPGEPSVLRVIERLGSLQFDPLEIAGRNHDLVLQARIAGYRREMTDALLYERRLLFEAYNKGLSILPTAELPLYRLTWDRPATATLAARSTSTRRSSRSCSTASAATVRCPRRTWGRAPRSTGTGGRRTRSARSWRRSPRPASWGSPGATATAASTTWPSGCSRRASWPSAEPSASRCRHRLLSRYRANGLLGAAGRAELWIGTGRRPRTGPARVTRAGGAARGADRRGRARPRRSSRGCAVPAWSSRPTCRCWRRPRRLPPARLPGAWRRLSACSPRSTRCAGIATCCAGSSASTTCGRSTSRRRGGGGATTCCRSCSVTVLSAGSSHASIGRRAPSACSGRGGSRASIRSRRAGSLRLSRPRSCVRRLRRRDPGHVPARPVQPTAGRRRRPGRLAVDQAERPTADDQARRCRRCLAPGRGPGRGDRRRRTSTRSGASSRSRPRPRHRHRHGAGPRRSAAPRSARRAGGCRRSSST